MLGKGLIIAFKSSNYRPKRKRSKGTNCINNETVTVAVNGPMKCHRVCLNVDVYINLYIKYIQNTLIYIYVGVYVYTIQNSNNLINFPRTRTILRFREKRESAGRCLGEREWPKRNRSQKSGTCGILTVNV